MYYIEIWFENDGGNDGDMIMIMKMYNYGVDNVGDW